MSDLVRCIVRPMAAAGLLAAGFLGGILFIASCGNDHARAAVNALAIVFSNTVSGLAATNVQAAIDETDARIDNLTAGSVAYSNTTSGLAATTAQAAIDEVEARVDGLERGVSIIDLRQPAVGGVTTIPDGSYYDVRPPAGETWILTAQSLRSVPGTSPYLTDGALEAACYFDVADCVAVSNTLWLRVRNSSGSPAGFAFAGFRAGRTFVGGIFIVPDASSQDVQPPAGETWLVVSASRGLSHPWYLTDGASDGMVDGSGQFWSGIFSDGGEEGAVVPITNTLYLRASNTSGAPVVFAYSGVKQ